MAKKLGFLLGILSLLMGFGVADWNILKQKEKGRLVGISLKNYCESWRMNVELNNIKWFEVVPGECVEYIGKYMTSTQYKVDCERAVEACTLYLSNSFVLSGDGKDAWIFDIDDTLLSNTPYYKKHQFGGEKLNKSALEEWMKEKKAPGLPHSLCLYNEIKSKGLKIFLISSRGEHLREATIDNLINVGYNGWTGLILRGVEDGHITVEKYKAGERRRLIEGGYHIWGIVGDQWSSLSGLPNARRTFKLPNSMYYVS